MTEKQAIKAAKAYHTKHIDKPTFVYIDRYEPGGFDWCTEHEYRYTSHQWVNENNIVWSSIEGYY